MHPKAALLNLGIFLFGCSIEQYPQTGSTREATTVDGYHVIFYNENTRGALVGKLNTGGFITTAGYSSGAFGGWTHITNTDSLNSLLFYNTNTGTGASGHLDQGQYFNTNNLNGFALGWTHISDARLANNPPTPLFYNSNIGSGAIGYNPSIRVYSPGTFSLSWTNIVANNSGILFYNSNNGAGAIAVPIPSCDTCFVLDNIRTTNIYGPGSFSSWTHIVAADSNIFFYNKIDGSAAIGRLVPEGLRSATAFHTDKVFQAGTFSGGWTHIVYTHGIFLFYCSVNGAGAIGEISNGTFVTTRSYPPGSFAVGWTHVVAGSSDIQPTPPPG